MKKLLLSMLLMTALIQVYADDVMRKEKDGTYVVNTMTLAADVKGYIESTPVEIYIKKNKIVKVVMLKNQETPKYNARVKKQMVPLYEGKKISKKSTVEVDGVTGATFTSDAVKEQLVRLDGIGVDVLTNEFLRNLDLFHINGVGVVLLGNKIVNIQPCKGHLEGIGDDFPFICCYLEQRITNNKPLTGLKRLGSNIRTVVCGFLSNYGAPVAKLNGVLEFARLSERYAISRR